MHVGGGISCMRYDERQVHSILLSGWEKLGNIFAKNGMRINVWKGGGVKGGGGGEDKSYEAS